MSAYEEILTDLRPFGPYQIRVFVLVSMFETPLAWAMLLPIFTSAKPSWTCLSHSNSTEIPGSNVTWINSTNLTSTQDSSLCLPGNLPCQEMVFSKEFTSILSEVNYLDIHVNL